MIAYFFSVYYYYIMNNFSCNITDTATWYCQIISIVSCENKNLYITKNMQIHWCIKFV